MNNKPVILITGATGNTGSAVARHVIRSAPKEYHIRLASHNENKLKNLFGKESNVELIRMDFKDKTSVRGALKNVERVWVTAPRPDKTMKQFDRIRWVNDFVDECKQLGSIKMLVFGSSYGAESDSTILGKEFRMAEKKIEQSGIPHCFLRLGPMIDILLALKDVTINKGMYPMLNGNTKMCPLWSYDIGRCAATVLLNPDPYRGKSYFLTGPEPITVEEQGRILSKVLHRQLNYQTVDRKQMVEYLKSTAPEYMLQLANSLNQAEGVVEWTELAAKSSVFATPSQDIKTLTGQPGTRYEDAIKSMQTAGLFDTTPA